MYIKYWYYQYKERPAVVNIVKYIFTEYYTNILDIFGGMFFVTRVARTLVMLIRKNSDKTCKIVFTLCKMRSALVNDIYLVFNNI